MGTTKAIEVNRNGNFVGGYIAPDAVEKVKEVQARLSMMSEDFGLGSVNITKALEFIISKFDVDSSIPIDPKAVGHASIQMYN